MNRPPRDDETVLGLKPDRFAPTGRFERNGRRRVYRETATNRLFYVDNQLDQLNLRGKGMTIDVDSQHLALGGPVEALLWNLPASATAAPATKVTD